MVYETYLELKIRLRAFFLVFYNKIPQDLYQHYQYLKTTPMYLSYRKKQRHSIPVTTC